MQNLQPKKSLGQHFLNDSFVAERIAGALGASGITNNVLEIGPGKGVLSEYLFRNEKFNCKFIEIDPDAARYFTERFPEHAGRLITGDFLELELSSLFEEAFLLIGNFPYNISTQILFRILENRDLIPEVVGMFQKEVAARVCSAPGSKVYGLTSVLIQTFYTCEMLFEVAPELFIPPPKVYSSVIRLKRNDFDIETPLYFRIVKAAFNQRRKTLRNALKQFTSQMDAMDPAILDKRAEQLSASDFLEIHAHIRKENQ